jgi:hypothetical protein
VGNSSQHLRVIIGDENIAVHRQVCASTINAAVCCRWLLRADGITVLGRWPWSCSRLAFFIVDRLLSRS